MASPPHIVGGTLTGDAVASRKAKAASKETRWPRKAAASRHPSDRLLAFLDDLYVLTTRDRARAARDTVVEIVQEECGIASNEGKTRAYSWAGGPPLPA